MASSPATCGLFSIDNRLITQSLERDFSRLCCIFGNLLTENDLAAVLGSDRGNFLIQQSKLAEKASFKRLDSQFLG
jgi:hypothetical protein